MPERSLSGRTVLIAGATSASGRAAARALVSAGARVIAVGRDRTKLDEQFSADVIADLVSTDQMSTDLLSTDLLSTAACDLSDERAVIELAARVHANTGPIDGVLHLVGGWRGGGGLAGQTDDDYRFLERSFTALRHVSRAFDDDLRSSSAGRSAIVSSTAVVRPLAGGANYSAVKAASEAWARALAQGFAKNARDAGAALAAASVIFRVKALEGLEERLAVSFVDLFARDAADVNDTVITLDASN